MKISIKNKDLFCESEQLILDSMIEEKRIDEACDRISAFVSAIANSKDFVGKVLTSSSYDKIVQKIANLLKDEDCSKNKIQNHGDERICIVVTELYKTGGHTEIVKLLKDIFPKSIVIATNYFGGVRQRENAVYSVKGMPDLVISASVATEKIKSLSKFIKNFADRVILVTHHHDVVALISSIKSCINPIFIFHSDHRISLGHTIGEFTHVALVPETMKNIPKYDGFYKICQSVVDCGYKIISNDSSLRSCTVGGGEKFDWAGPISLPKIIASLFLNNNIERHFHIGMLSDEQIDMINQELRFLNIDCTRFSFVGAVESLWKSALENDINLVIGSAPIHGTRSAIEIMGAGIPYLPYSGNIGSIDMDRFFYPKNIEFWSNIEELNSKISNVRRILEDYSNSMRLHYEKNFHYDFARRDLFALINSSDKIYGSPRLFKADSDTL